MHVYLLSPSFLPTTCTRCCLASCFGNTLEMITLHRFTTVTCSLGNFDINLNIKSLCGRTPCKNCRGFRYINSLSNLNHSFILTYLLMPFSFFPFEHKNLCSFLSCPIVASKSTQIKSSLYFDT